MSNSKNAKRNSKDKKREKARTVVTPSQAKQQLPKYKQALRIKDKEVKALRKKLSQTEAAAQALSKKAKANEAEWQREKAELQQELAQTQEKAAAKERALEAERAEFAKYKRRQQKGQNEDLLPQLREMARKNKEDWERERERFINYKKRSERNRKENYQKGRLDTLEALLPVIDDLEHVAKSLPQDIRENNWGEGMGLIHRKHLRLLKRYNVEVINPAIGDILDANFHESIAVEDNDELESDQVIETIQKGYRIGDRLLRAALVKVAR